MSSLLFSSFPKTEKPKEFALAVINAFNLHHDKISTIQLGKGLESNDVLRILRPELVKLNFQVERSRKQNEKICRPVFFGENGVASVSYEIDAFNDEHKTGLEIEAGRAWMGNAVYRDLIQSMVMVELEHLILAVPLKYKYKSNSRDCVSKDYENSKNLIDTLYSHTRFKLPYSLTLIGY